MTGTKTRDENLIIKKNLTTSHKKWFFHPMRFSTPARWERRDMNKHESFQLRYVCHFNAVFEGIQWMENYLFRRNESATGKWKKIECIKNELRENERGIRHVTSSMTMTLKSQGACVCC